LNCIIKGKKKALDDSFYWRLNLPLLISWIQKQGNRIA